MNVREYSYTEVESAINSWIIGQHAERNRNILKRRLLDGITYENLADEFGMSVRQIKNVVYRNERLIFKHL